MKKQTGRRTRLLRVSPLRLRRLFGEMVRQARKDGFSGNHDVFAVLADEGLDGKGY